MYWENLVHDAETKRTNEMLRQELCDIVLNQGAYRGLREPGYRRLVTRQLLCADSSLNWVELQDDEFFRRRFSQYAPQLILDWTTSFANEYLKDDLEQKIQEQDSELSGDLDH